MTDDWRKKAQEKLAEHQRRIEREQERTEQFNAEASIQARDEAIARVIEHGDEYDRIWDEEALKVTHGLALMREDMTTDDVWLELHYRDIEPPREPRRIVGVMNKAAKLGWIVKTDDSRPSIMKRAHGRPKWIWKSLLYRALS